MLLIAVSGGPDSMALLFKYRKKKNLHVAHVNYHAREDSNIDQSIVEEFCKENNIACHVLELKKSELPKSNFQEWAREKRYGFFKEVYDKNNCKLLITAHHIDDFLETCEMQMKSKRQPSQFGIPLRSNVFGMNILRPFIDLYWKSDLLRFCKKKNISYATDSSNAKALYERNKVRLDLMRLTFKEKQARYKWYLMSNKILKKVNSKVDRLYTMWEKTEFKTRFLTTSPYKDKLVFKLIHSNFEDIELSSKKIESIIDFIGANAGGKVYKLSDKCSLKIANSKVTFIK